MPLARRSSTHLVAALVGLLAVSFLVMRASEAAFSQEVAADATLQAGTVDFDDSVSLSFPDGMNLAPGQTVKECVEITYTGSLSANVTAAVSGSGVLAGALAVSIADGPTCDDISTEPLATFTLADGLAAEDTGWSPQDADTSHAFEVSVTLDADADNTLQGEGAAATFTWTAQTD